MQKISIAHMSNAHNDWLRALEFYKQELGILKSRLTEVAGKNTDPTMAKQVEHYENQFKVQTENIDKLNHAIHQNLSKIKDEIQVSSAGYVDGELVQQHNGLREQYASEEKVVNELRHDFNRFAAEWL